jgi:hypothetical protein
MNHTINISHLRSKLHLNEEWRVKSEEWRMKKGYLVVWSFRKLGNCPQTTKQPISQTTKQRNISALSVISAWDDYFFLYGGEEKRRWFDKLTMTTEYSMRITSVICEANSITPQLRRNISVIRKISSISVKRDCMCISALSICLFSIDDLCVLCRRTAWQKDAHIKSKIDST